MFDGGLEVDCSLLLLGVSLNLQSLTSMSHSIWPTCVDIGIGVRAYIGLRGVVVVVGCCAQRLQQWLLFE